MDFEKLFFSTQNMQAKKILVEADTKRGFSLYDIVHEGVDNSIDGGAEIIHVIANTDEKHTDIGEHSYIILDNGRGDAELSDYFKCGKEIPFKNYNDLYASGRFGIGSLSPFDIANAVGFLELRGRYIY